MTDPMQKDRNKASSAAWMFLLAASSVFLGNTKTSAQQSLAEPAIQTVQITVSIYMLVGTGGNIGLSIGPDGALLVDDQFATMTDSILAAVGELSDGGVRFIINTHWHGDHTGGNENLSRAGAIIVAHDNVRDRMSREVYLPLFDSRTEPAPAAARPNITYSSDTTFHWNGDVIHVFHVPSAHTDGDSIVHFRDANVIHMGDTLWTSGYPRIDSDVGGGSVQGVIDAVESAMSLANDETQFIPGHGDLPPRGTAFLEEYVAMLRAIQERVSDLIQEGLSEDAVVAAEPTREFDSRWGGGYMSPGLFTRVVYRSLAGDL
jgi:glyoxylase-like metal-dependent hydrolase (beta-lactamase superfamily II)